MSGVSGLKLNSILSLLLVAMFVLGGFASLTSLETAANAQAEEDADMNAVDPAVKSGSDSVAGPDAVECQELLAKYGKSDNKVGSTFKLWNPDHQMLDPKEDADSTNARSESDRVDHSHDDQDDDRVDDHADDRVDDQDRRGDQGVRDRIERLRQAIRDRIDRDRGEQREEMARHIVELRAACAEGDREDCAELREILERLGDDDERHGDERQDRRGHRHHRGHWGDWGERDHRGDWGERDHRGDWGERDHRDYRGGEEVSPRFTFADDLDEEHAAILKQCLQHIVVDVHPADISDSDWRNAAGFTPLEREWDETRERDPTRD
jgi:hypothetical protein